MIVRLCGAVALALGISASGTAAPAADEPATSDLRFGRVQYSFGVVDQGEAISADYPFENAGRVPLTLSAPIVGCGCEAEIVGSMDLEPGDSGVVRFTCDSSQMAGPVRLTATIHSSEIARRAIVLSMAGEVLLEVLAEPGRVYLGKVIRGERKPGVFSVSLGSAGGRRIAMRGASAPGPYLEVLAEKGGDRFGVRVEAEAPLGSFTENVEVRTTSERFAVLTVPVTGIVVERLPERRW